LEWKYLEKDWETIDRDGEACYLLAMLRKKISLFMLGLGVCCLFFTTGCQTSRYQAGGAPSNAGMAYSPTSVELLNGQGTATDDYRNMLAYPGRF
jgi:hypothetical protein